MSGASEATTTGALEAEPLPDVPASALAAALAEALRTGGDELDPSAAAAARAALERASARLGTAADATVVALAGATGSGKSSLVNALAGLTVTDAGVRRPTTAVPVACIWGPVPDALLDHLGVPRRHRTERVSPLDADAQDPLDGLVLLDLPDHDSTAVANRLQVDRLVELVDLVVWVADPQKYADAALHQGYLQHLTGHQDVVLVVLNQLDTLDPVAAAACTGDLRRLLDADGLERVRLMGVSARTGQGVAALRSALTAVVQEHTAARLRVRADLAAAAVALSAGVGPGEPDPDDLEGVEALVGALAQAAGVSAVADAVRASTVRQGRAATGWPFTRWLSRLRPDPLRRLHLGGPGPGSGGAWRRSGATAVGASTDLPVLEAGAVAGASDQAVAGELARLTRSSVPEPTPGQRAQVAVATRRTASAAAEALPERWGRAVRAAAGLEDGGAGAGSGGGSGGGGASRGGVASGGVAGGGDLADALDQAVQSVPLPRGRPRWWAPVGALQGLLALVTVLGGLWLLALAVLGWLQLPRPSTPSVGASPLSVPDPTLALVGGGILGAVVAALAGMAVRAAAARRAAAVGEQLRGAVAVVAREHLLDAVAAVLRRHRQTREALERALAPAGPARGRSRVVEAVRGRRR